MKAPGKGPSPVFPCHMFLLCFFPFCFSSVTSSCVRWHWSGHGHFWVQCYICMLSVFVILYYYLIFVLRIQFFPKENPPICINFVPHKTWVCPGSQMKQNNHVKHCINYFLLKTAHLPDLVAQNENRIAHNSVYRHFDLGSAWWLFCQSLLGSLQQQQSVGGLAGTRWSKMASPKYMAVVRLPAESHCFSSLGLAQSWSHRTAFQEGERESGKASSSSRATWAAFCLCKHVASSAQM